MGSSVFSQLLLVALRVVGPDGAGDAWQFNNKPHNQTGWRKTYIQIKKEEANFMVHGEQVFIHQLANQSDRNDYELMKTINFIHEEGKKEKEKIKIKEQRPYSSWDSEI